MTGTIDSASLVGLTQVEIEKLLRKERSALKKDKQRRAFEKDLELLRNRDSSHRSNVSTNISAYKTTQPTTLVPTKSKGSTETPPGLEAVPTKSKGSTATPPGI